MTKRIAALLTVLMIAWSMDCMAANIDRINSDDHVLERSEIALGGIMVGMTRAQAEGICGKPTARRIVVIKGTSRDYGKLYMYVYGTSLQVTYNKDVVMLMYLDASESSGVATPAGVTVGDPEDKVTQIYGTPWCYTKDDRGEENFVYRDKGGDTKLIFGVENGRVIYIGIIGEE
ncbi:hypothetical protein TAMA11512_00620 [Selenomonas sp. TAMA-11512]|uniref:hypothetical protein n=1 Tax=Selenomonas sp. TAMA-11512 TaxID=3095337 RepID=UPI003087511A|nr:hypothetical protein TAMA11512_00620 [Selenomonas sp. TAMA-11512]